METCNCNDYNRKDRIYNIHTDKEMAKDQKKMNAQCTAIETQMVDNIIHSENIHHVPTRRQTLFETLGTHK